MASPTTIVCLDCGDEGRAVVTPSWSRDAADSYVRMHLCQTEHRTVTVPGWPRHREAIALARVHVEASRVPGIGDELCCSEMEQGQLCGLKARHLGECEEVKDDPARVRLLDDLRAEPPDPMHWLVSDDPAGGQFGSSCYCAVGVNHDGRGNPVEVHPGEAQGGDSTRP
jgi:hypothetical protein